MGVLDLDLGDLGEYDLRETGDSDNRFSDARSSGDRVRDRPRGGRDDMVSWAEFDTVDCGSERLAFWRSC